MQELLSSWLHGFLIIQLILYILSKIRFLFLSQSKNILHIINSMRHANNPQCRLYSTPCKIIPALCLMCNLKPLAKPAKHDCMLTHNITRPYCLDAYLFFLSFPDNTFPRIYTN